MINNIQVFAPTQKYNYPKASRNNWGLQDVSFGNKISIPKTTTKENIEKIANKVEFAIRVGFNSVVSFFGAKNINTKYETFKNVDSKSPDFINKLYQQSMQMVGSKQVEVNVEKGELQNICQSGDSCIFIMNHDNQRQDPTMMAFFYGLLAREHILNETTEKCPRPKFIMNDDILKSSNPKTREIMEKFGAVGVDASLFVANQVLNGKRMLPVLKDFIENKAHIFIFPEGKMCGFKKWDMEYKFQTGIADIIGKIARKKDRVKVVPLGFAYDKELGSIHIGEPIYFKSEKGQTLSTCGSSDSPFASAEYKKFFDKTDDLESFKTITKDGAPVFNTEAPDYIAGILCENLKISKAEAKKAIEFDPNKEPPEIYCLNG